MASGAILAGMKLTAIRPFGLVVVENVTFEGDSYLPDRTTKEKEDKGLDED